MLFGLSFYPTEQIAPAFRRAGAAGFLPLEMAGQILLFHRQMKMAGSDPGIDPLDSRRVLSQRLLANNSVEVERLVIHYHTPGLGIGGGGSQAKQLQCFGIIPRVRFRERCIVSRMG